MSKADGITVQRSKELERIYSTLNRELFKGCLPDVMISTVFGIRTDTKFVQNGHTDPTTGDLRHEVQINQQLINQGVPSLCQAIVSEQLHLWELTRTSKPPKRRYHSTQWVELARDMGFHVDKDCGMYVQLSPLPDGCFMKAVHKVKNMTLPLPTNSTQFDQKLDAEPQKKDKNLQKWVCPKCDMNVRGASGVNILCGVHRVKLVLQPK